MIRDHFSTLSTGHSLVCYPIKSLSEDISSTVTVLVCITLDKIKEPGLSTELARYRDTGANLLGTVEDDRRPGGCIPLCLRLLCGYYVNVSIARIFSSCFNGFWRGRWEYETAVMGMMRVVLPRRGGSSDFPKSKRLLESFWRQYVRSVVQNQVPTALGTVVAAIAAVAAAAVVAVAAVVPLAL